MTWLKIRFQNLLSFLNWINDLNWVIIMMTPNIWNSMIIFKPLSSLFIISFYLLIIIKKIHLKYHWGIYFWSHQYFSVYLKTGISNWLTENEDLMLSIPPPWLCISSSKWTIPFGFGQCTTCEAVHGSEEKKSRPTRNKYLTTVTFTDLFLCVDPLKKKSTTFWMEMTANNYWAHIVC